MLSEGFKYKVDPNINVGIRKCTSTLTGRNVLSNKTQSMLYLQFFYFLSSIYKKKYKEIQRNTKKCKEMQRNAT